MTGLIHYLALQAKYKSNKLQNNEQKNLQNNKHKDSKTKNTTIAKQKTKHTPHTMYKSERSTINVTTLDIQKTIQTIGDHRLFHIPRFGYQSYCFGINIII